jgi:hypothetical protein
VRISDDESGWRDERTAAQAMKAPVHRKARPMGKKIKGKAKPKRATARS